MKFRQNFRPLASLSTLAWMFKEAFNACAKIPKSHVLAQNVFFCSLSQTLIHSTGFHVEIFRNKCIFCSLISPKMHV